MANKQLSPADVARDTFKLLASRKIAPTPEAYAQVYYEISNGTDDGPAMVAGHLVQPALLRVLQVGVPALLQGRDQLQADVLAMAELVKSARTEGEWLQIQRQVKDLCLKLDQVGQAGSEQHKMLVRLFRLLLENIETLVEDDSWLSGQVANVQNLLDQPLDAEGLEHVTKSMKEVIYKQTILKNTLTDAKDTVKSMMLTFLDRLNAMAAATGVYHEKLGSYTQKMAKAKGLNEINALLHEVMRETKDTQAQALALHEEMVQAKKQADAAHQEIASLETKLAQMSALAHQDELTGSFNRRGLDDAFEREMARAMRKKTPLCLAMLDLDDFKKLNDTYGHQVGDTVLVHLVAVIKDTLRSMDIVARFGGEEFVVLLPDTSIDAAKETIVRLQRELTNRIFMHEQRRLFITFSAGLTAYLPGEPAAVVMGRADAALYEAKKQGKHRVVSK